jgi:hypothetical protein
MPGSLRLGFVSLGRRLRRRAVAAPFPILVVLVLLVTATVLLAAVPGLRLYLISSELRVALEIAHACIAVFASLALVAADQGEHVPARNAFVAALVTIGVSNVGFGVGGMALARAGIGPEEVDYINAHGTGTKANDEIETQAIRRVFGTHADRLSVSSTKSMHGHALGASGALEMIACLGALRDDLVPPTIGYREADPACDLDVTPNEARKRPVRAAISNAFAFGGTNVSVAVKKFA